MNSIDFAHICSLFLISNDRSLEKHDKIQQKKFSELLKEYPPKNDPEKVIFNFSKATLNESEKALLSKGLNFSLPPKQLKYADYLLNFELFSRDICKLDILSNDNLEFLKIRIKDVALSSLRYFNLNVPQHLSELTYLWGEKLGDLACVEARASLGSLKSQWLTSDDWPKFEFGTVK